MNEVFRRFAQKVSILVASPVSFILACSMIIIWALCGSFFHYSDTWELIINTATTIITFLMVFVIQNSQNRDMKSLHLKMDELIRANHHARNSLMALETMTEHDLDKLQQEFSSLVEAKIEMKKRRK